MSELDPAPWSTSQDSSSGVQVVAIIGAGTMGHGIAHVAATAGYETRIYDLSHDLVDGALFKIRSNLEKGVERGKLSAQQRDTALSHLKGTTDFNRGITGADIVIEAVPEKLELKHQVLGQAAGVVSERTILATNTSSLSVESIAVALPTPERVIGMHFFNPVHLMKLLEIVVAPTTSADVVETAQMFGQRLGKETITVKDFPGFATSRLGLVIGLEAIRMVEQGVATAEDIDKAMTLGYGFPMGPLRLTDLVGLDVRLHIAEYLSQKLPEGSHFRPPQLLRDMVAQGKLGKKSGQGFYTW